MPDLLINAYYLLGKDWQETRNEWVDVGHKAPPVMITVANRTETSARIKYAFDHNQILISELCVPEKTLQIDSKVLSEAESETARPPRDRAVFYLSFRIGVAAATFLPARAGRQR